MNQSRRVVPTVECQTHTGVRGGGFMANQIYSLEHETVIIIFFFRSPNRTDFVSTAARYNNTVETTMVVLLYIYTYYAYFSNISGRHNSVTTYTNNARFYIHAYRNSLHVIKQIVVLNYI